MGNPKDIEFLLSTGIVSLIIITAISIVKFILPYILKDTKKDVSNLQEDFNTLVHKIDELIGEIRKTNNNTYENRKEIEKILLVIEFLKNSNESVLKRLTTLETKGKE